MTIEEAIKYLQEHSEYNDEWSGAGMWEAVEAVLVQAKWEKKITEKYLKSLLKKAKNR